MFESFNELNKWKIYYVYCDSKQILEYNINK